MGRKARAPIGPKVGPAAEVPENTTEEIHTTSHHEWWHDLKGEDPITLEPLASLDIPPFVLKSDGASHYFDAVALASYVTRRAVFENPLNRRPISREECARLDDHIQRYVPCSRDFRVADALDLQCAIRARITASGDRSAATRRREATAALHGLFNFPSIQAAESLTAARGDGGWTVVDDDLQRHIEAEAIAAMHAAAAAEAARPGGAVPDASPSNFPELSEEALLASERLANMLREGNGYASAAQAMADEAARESQRRAADAAARQAAAKEAAARREAARRAATAKALEAHRRQEVLRAEATDLAAERRAEIRRRSGEGVTEALRASVIESAAVAEKLAAEERASALKRAEEEACEAEEEKTEKLKREQEEQQAAEERKKEKEAEKKRRQKEKKRLEKEKAAAEQAKLELEAAKRAALLRCDMCGEGILGKNFFEVMGQKFCSTACVKKKRAESAC